MMSRSSTCRCGHCESHNLTLMALRSAYQRLGPEDLPDPNEPSIKRELLKLRGEVDEDGMVTFYPEVGE